jgi:hypothetical protein
MSQWVGVDQAVVAPRAGDAPGDEPGFKEDFQVVGGLGLGQPQQVLELAVAEVGVLLEQVEDLDANGVAQGLAEPCQALCLGIGQKGETGNPFAAITARGIAPVHARTSFNKKI